MLKLNSLLSLSFGLVWFGSAWYKNNNKNICVCHAPILDIPVDQFVIVMRSISMPPFFIAQNFLYRIVSRE